MALALDRVAELYAESTDFTVGIEEEFATLDATTLDLAPRFEELRDAAVASDPDLADAIARQRTMRERLFALVAAHGTALASTGTHPWADYREQPNIDTEHYRGVVEGLQYVARRNNTFSLHVHVGIRDIDRAVKVCDRLRSVLPHLLAISASSPYLDG